MTIEIDDGIVFCRGNQCTAQIHGHPLCMGCPLEPIFEEIYDNCDPLQCRKILCASCEDRASCRYIREPSNELSL